MNEIGPADQTIVVEEGEGRHALLVDFGSTYTKAVVVDLHAEQVVGTAQAPTTVASDINEGLECALQELRSMSGRPLLRFARYIACSSAAGGLRMVAIGLADDLTSHAAEQAALNAGSRVVGVFSGHLDGEDLARIEDLTPDIVLLAGGTDGGDATHITANAERLARLSVQSPVVVAGNVRAADLVVQTLAAGGKEVHATENVLPEISRLNVEPAREVIREVFIRRVVEAKGLSSVKVVSGGIVMPTPDAVLAAAEVLSVGVSGQPGIGDLMVVDVGGATTDVHSVGDGSPRSRGVRWLGPGDSRVKRTVEGDLGLRVSAHSLWNVAGDARLRSLTNLGEYDFEAACTERSRDWPMIATTDVEREVDIVLASAAVQLATERHAGRVETRYSPVGLDFVLHGKDLTRTACVIGTGGSLSHGGQSRRILMQSLYSESNAAVLKPKQPDLALDSDYILSAMGLLSTFRPDLALRLMTRHLSPAD